MRFIEFDGERVIPGRVESALWAEHLSRYALARPFVRNANVLDFGCGSGYGARYLRDVGASRVLGIDRSLEAVDYARQHFGCEAVQFAVTDCLRPALRGGDFDVIVAFEIIEHVEDHRAFVDRAARLLSASGYLILSTPNKTTYTDERGEDAENPFHVHEFYRRELEDLLRGRFEVVDLLGQWVAEGVLFSDLQSPLTGGRCQLRALPESLEEADDGEALESFPDYFIAVCRPSASTDGSLSAEPVFMTSRTNEIRRRRLRIEELQREVEELAGWGSTLEETLGERDGRILWYQERLELLESKLADRRQALAAERERRREIEQTVVSIRARICDLERELGREILGEPTDGALSPLGPGNAEEAVDGNPTSHASGTTVGEQCGDRWDGDPVPKRLLFIQSGNAEAASHCLRVLRQRLFLQPRLTYVVHDLSVVPGSRVLPDDTKVVKIGTSLRTLVSSARSFRREDFDCVVVMLTGEPGYRRFKLLSVLLLGERLLMFNENADCFFLGPLKLTRHLMWRIRQRITPATPLHLVRTALKVIREDGFTEFLLVSRRRLKGELRSFPATRPKVRRLRRIRENVFPYSDEPRLSIVIPVHNQFRVTYACLASILEHGGELEYEVIVVDDASTDRTAEMLSKQRNVEVVSLAENLGFVAACNTGADRARGEIVLFLNNDTLVQPGALQELVSTFQAHPTCGAAGAKLIYPNGSLQEAGGIVWRDGNAWNYGKFDDPDRPEYNYIREVDYCSGAALAVRRNLLRKLGGFDMEFAPGYWEDTDLCFRIRRMGFKVLYQPRSVIVHLEGETSGRDLAQGMKSYQEVNRQKFVERWERELRGQVVHDPDLAFLARDRNRDRLALVFDHYVPTYDKDAGSYVMFMLLKSLRELGYRVVLWPDNLYRTPEYTDRIQDMGVEVIYGNQSFQKYIRKHGRFFDVAVMHRAKIADKYLWSLETIPRRVYVCADLEFLREARRAEVEGFEPNGLEALRRREVSIMRGVDRVAVHSPVEQELLKEDLPEVEVSVLPLPVRAGSLDGLDFEGRQGLLFVGSSHPPNVDAILHYEDDLAQAIAQRVPEAVLKVIGEAGSKIRGRQRRCPSVVFEGFVPSLSAYYRSARVFVAPLRYGAGVKGKILEAMSFGLPVVTTPVGAEGIPIEHGVSGFVAEDVSSFVDAVELIYKERDIWYQVRENAYNIIQNEYSEESFRRYVQGLVEG